VSVDERKFTRITAMEEEEGEGEAGPEAPCDMGELRAGDVIEYIPRVMDVYHEAGEMVMERIRAITNDPETRIRTTRGADVLSDDTLVRRLPREGEEESERTRFMVRVSAFRLIEGVRDDIKTREQAAWDDVHEDLKRMEEENPDLKGIAAKMDRADSAAPGAVPGTVGTKRKGGGGGGETQAQAQRAKVDRAQAAGSP
jgi:hypothetical protein